MTEIHQSFHNISDHNKILHKVRSIQSVEKNSNKSSDKKIYQSGAWYIGELDGCQRSGWGRFKWLNGGIYEGYYVNNKRHGKGMYTWNDDTVYIGMFENDLRHGYGELTWKNKESYHGQFFNDMRHGLGFYKWPDGSQYEGAFEKNMKCGFGIFTLKNGDTFKGIYKDDQRNGAGIFTYEETGKQDVGIWKSTMLIRLCTTVEDAFLYEHVAEHCINAGDNISQNIKFANSNRACLKKIRSSSFLEFYDSLNLPNSFPLNDILNGIRSVHSSKGCLEESSLKLLQSASVGDVSTVSKILEEGLVNANVCDNTGHSALLAAAINCHLDVVNCLLDHGTDINILTNEGLSALSACHILLYSEQNFISNIAEIMPKLNPFNTVEIEKRTGMVLNRNDRKMIMTIYESVFILLLSSKKRKVGVSKRKKSCNSTKSSSGCSTRQTGVYHDDEELLPCAFDQWKLDFYQRSMDRVKDVEDVNRTFKDDMLNPRFTLQYHNTHVEDEHSPNDFEKASSSSLLSEYQQPLPTTAASECGYGDASIKSDFGERASISRGTMANMINIERKPHLEQIIQLLLKRGANPNSSILPTPVLFFPIKSADPKAVLDLLKQGADTAARNNEKKLSPLHIAAALPRSEGIEITKLLLQFNADPNLQDGYIGDNIAEGRTPLHIVCCREDNYEQSEKIGRLLLEHGADSNLLCAGNSALSLAIASGNDLLLDTLLEFNANPNLKLTHGLGSILCIAVSFQAERHRPPNERMKLIEKLINAGANILTPVRISDKFPPGTVVDYAYHVFAQDRRIACTPYHALSSLERECYNARKYMLECLGNYLRIAALKKEESLQVGSLIEDALIDASVYAKSFQRGKKYSHSVQSQDRDASCGLRFVIIKVGGKSGFEVKRRLRYCYECGRSLGVCLSPCTRCKEVFYCSKACKLKAWNIRHREECAKRSGQKMLSAVGKIARSPTANAFVHSAGGNSRSPTANGFVHSAGGKSSRSPTANGFVHSAGGRKSRSPTANAFVHSTAGKNSRSPTPNAFVHSAAGNNSRKPRANVFVHSEGGKKSRTPTASAFVHSAGGKKSWSPTPNAFVHSAGGNNSRTPTANAFVTALQNLQDKKANITKLKTSPCLPKL